GGHGGVAVTVCGYLFSAPTARAAAYPLALHDALPIYGSSVTAGPRRGRPGAEVPAASNAASASFAARRSAASAPATLCTPPAESTNCQRRAARAASSFAAALCRTRSEERRVGKGWRASRTR